MENMELEYRIFTETTEDMGILYNSYKDIPKYIDEFLNVIEDAMKKVLPDPEHVKVNLTKEISDFKSKITRQFKPSAIEVSKIPAMKKTLKSCQTSMDSILNRLAKDKNKMAFGGKYLRWIINKPKVYSKNMDYQSYDNINGSIRNIARALDWVEKITIDLFNMIDQDLNILTIIDKVYVSKGIYESIAVIDDFKDEYFGEKKTQLEYALEKFKRKFRYNLVDNTIIVDGEVYEVDLDINNPYMIDSRGHKVPRQTCIISKKIDDTRGYKYKIVLSKSTLQYQTMQQIEAAIQHEIGHKFVNHPLNQGSPAYKRLQQMQLNRNQKNMVIDGLKAADNIADKYKDLNSHANRDEFGADRYAANRTSSKAVKTGTRQAYKNFSRDIDKAYYSQIRLIYDNYISKCNRDGIEPQFRDINDFIKNHRNSDGKKLMTLDQYKTKHNQSIQGDMNARSKALRDRALINSPLYKESDDFLQEGVSMEDDLDWVYDYLMEEGETGGPPPLDDEPSTSSGEKKSMPKQTDSAESDKNGVRRKKLYVAFIEWCKAYNNKNTFGSIFDKDAFNVTYPFVPEEMRYFYRLANPILCVLGGQLTFFQVSELRKLNAQNPKMNEMLIFAATPDDMRVFNVEDKKVYRGTDENGTLTLQEVLGSTFDLYIQNMIKQGDILNGPIEDEE